MKQIKFYIVFVFSFVGVLALNAQHNLYHYSEQSNYDKAIQLFEKGQYNACIKQLESLSANSIYSDKATLYSALAHLKLLHPNGETAVSSYIKKSKNETNKSLGYFELGNYAYSEKDYKSAIEYYKNAGSEFPKKDLAELKFKLGYSYFTQKEFGSAEPLFYYSKMNNTPYKSASTYYLGYILMEQNKWTEAFTTLKEIEQDESYKKVVATMLIKCQYNLNQYKELITYFEAKNTESYKYGMWEEASMFAGIASFELQNFTKCVELFQPYIKSGGVVSRENRFRLGYAYFVNNQFDSAIEHLKLAAVPDDSLAQVVSYYLGLSYLKTKNQAFAKKAFFHASELTFNKKLQEEALYNYGKLSYETKDFANTILAFRKLLESYPNSNYENDANEKLSEAYLNSDNFYDALVYLESVRNKSAKTKEAYQYAAYMLAVKYYNCYDFGETEQYLDKAFNYPEDKMVLASSYFLKGEMLSQHKEYNQAIMAYAGVFTSDPNRKSPYYLKARYGIAYAYYNHSEYSSALSHFDFVFNNAKDLDMKYDSKLRMGDCYFVTKKYSNAAECYNLVSVESNYLKDYALYQYGLVSYLSADYPNSKKAFTNLITKRPTSGYVDNALYQLGTIDIEQSNYPSAVTWYSKVINEHPNSDLAPKSLEKRALAYTNIGQSENAKNDYVALIEKHPRTDEAKSAIYGLQELLPKLGQSEAFDGYLSAYKNANPESKGIENVEYENAKTLLFAEKYDKAVNAFMQFMINYPNSILLPEARYFLAESYRYYGKISDALMTYEAVLKENKSENITKAISKCADLYFDSENYPEALKKYQYLGTYSSNNKDILNGSIGEANSYFKLNDFKNTIQKVSAIMDNPALKGENKNKAILLRGKAYKENGNDSLALNDWRTVLLNSNFESGAEANYLRAKFLYDKEKYDESIVQLRELTKKYASFDYWVGNAYLLIAENYLAMGESFQAKATIKSVIDNSTNKLVLRKANEMLEFIEQEGETPKDTVVVEPLIIEDK